jgi:hypothetical protein
MKLNVDGSCIAAMGQASVKCQMQVGTMLEKSTALQTLNVCNGAEETEFAAVF